MSLFGSSRLFPVVSTLALLAAVACSAPADSGDGSEPAESQEAELNEAKALGMTDVTVLYPMPKSIEFFDDMLGPTSESDRGELLPSDLFAQLAPIAAPAMTGPDGKSVDPQKTLFSAWEDSFSMLRVVGIRLDPCFGGTPTGLGASDCMNTIRLTAQFFISNPNTTSGVIPDGRSAIHLFYKLTREEFTALSKGMLALRKATGLPLQKGMMTARGVHPTLAAEGLRGPYANGLKDLILKYAGEQSLTQIAFCVQDRGGFVNGYYTTGQVPDSRWVFGRFEYKAGDLRPLDVSTLNYTGLQTIDTAAGNAQRDAVIVTPPIKIADNFLQSFNRKPEANNTLDPAKMEQARKASLNLQNPNKYNARTADCASCHMAKQATPQHAADPLDFKSYTYRLDHTHDVFGPFRLFGYDSSANPILSARVVNETAVVLEYLNKVVMK